MKTWLLEGLRVVAPILVLGAGVVGFRFIGTPPETKPREAEGEFATAVETIRPNMAEDGLKLKFDGLVVPYREVVLGADVAGRVTTKYPTWRAGSFVDATTKLLEIDTDVYKTAERVAEAEYKSAKLSYEDAQKTELDNLDALEADAMRRVSLAEGEHQRTQQLYREGIATKASLDSVEQSLVQARSELTNINNQRRLREKKVERLELAMEVAKARWANAARDLRRSTVKAPCCGVVVEEHVEQDGYVQRGEKLLVIEDTSRVEIHCDLTLSEVAWLWRDRRAGTVPAESPVAPEATGSPSDPATQPTGFEPTPSPFETDEFESSDESPEVEPEKHPLDEFDPGDEPFVDTDPTDNAAYLLPPVPVTVSFDVAGRTYQWKGVFDRYDGLGIDEKTRTVPCRITVPSPRDYLVDGEPGGSSGPRALVRGMYVRVEAAVEPDTALLEIPERAVQPGGEVWVVDQRLDSETGEPVLDATTKEAQLELKITPIEPVWRSSRTVYLDAGKSPLQPSSQLVVSPLPAARNGLLVKVVPTVDPASEATPSAGDTTTASNGKTSP